MQRVALVFLALAPLSAWAQEGIPGKILDDLKSATVFVKVVAGNTAGPVVDSSGTLLGISVAKVSGTQIRLAIPARELSEMLLGRVHKVETKRIGTSGENVEFNIRVLLIDPMRSMKSVTIHTIHITRISVPPQADKDGRWKKIATGMRAHDLKIAGATASGTISLATNSTRPMIYWFQIRFVRGDKETRYTEPSELKVEIPVDVPGAMDKSPLVEVPDNRGGGRSSPAVPGMKPPGFGDKKIVKKIDAGISNVVSGAAGRYLFLHLADRAEVAVFDVSREDVTNTLTVPMDALVAASINRLIVISPFKHEIHRWSLDDFRKEPPARLPFDGLVRAVAVGHSAQGPMLVHWAVGTGALDAAKYVLLDVDTLSPIGLSAVRQQHSSRSVRLIQPVPAYEVPLRRTSYRDQIHLRASGSGLAFGIWCSSHSPSGLETFLINDGLGSNVYQHTSTRYVIPNADGSGVLTASGYYSPNLVAKRGSQMCIPSYSPRYYLSLPTGDQKRGTVIDSVTETPVLQLDDLAEMGDPRRLWTKTDFTLEKRYHLIPRAGLLITIPPSDDRLVLRKVDLRIDPTDQPTEE